MLALNEYSEVLLELRKTPRARQLLGESETPAEPHDPNFTDLLPTNDEASGLVPQTQSAAHPDMTDTFRGFEAHLEQMKNELPPLGDFRFPSPSSDTVQDRERQINDNLAALAGSTALAFKDIPAEEASGQDQFDGDFEKTREALMQFLDEEAVEDDEDDDEDSGNLYDEPDPELPDFKAMTKEEREDFCQDDFFLSQLLRYDTSYRYTEADLRNEKVLNRAIDLVHHKRQGQLGLTRVLTIHINYDALTPAMRLKASDEGNFSINQDGKERMNQKKKALALLGGKALAELGLVNPKQVYVLLRKLHISEDQ